VAILLGIAAGNSFLPFISARLYCGIDFSKGTLLRFGIVLYGFRITFQEIAEVGWVGVAVAAVIVTSTFVLAVQLGTRLFKLDRHTAILIGAGSAICGAAAVAATEPVLRAQAHKTSIAVATVVLFGTVAMFLYPLLYPYLGMSPSAFGLFAGSTIHEVAQVVAAGNAVGEEAAQVAVIEKMLRVMMLAPFLLLLSGSLGSAAAGEARMRRTRLAMPWFAVLFIAASAVSSLQVLPPAAVSLLVQIDTVLLAMAMTALGLRTQALAIWKAGLKPLLLALLLFVFLVVGGYTINVGLMRLFGAAGL
jgi:uncharacterized integral membrane protein (TIGR00698 family)